MSGSDRHDRARSAFQRRTAAADTACRPRRSIRAPARSRPIFSDGLGSHGYLNTPNGSRASAITAVLIA